MPTDPETLHALVAKWREKASRYVPGTGGSEFGRCETWANCADELARALLAEPVEPAPYGSEVLCPACAQTFCPSGERLHFHHDGCPACDSEPATPTVTCAWCALGLDTQSGVHSLRLQKPGGQLVTVERPCETPIVSEKD